jgi:hypothetical protein
VNEENRKKKKIQGNDSDIRLLLSEANLTELVQVGYNTFINYIIT